MKSWRLCFAILSIAATPCAAQSHNREVKIHNLDSESVYYLYATNAGAEGWGDDWLGDDVIIEDEVMRFNFEDGSGACLFDIKVEFADDSTQELYKVNVCTVSHIDANRSGMAVSDD